MARPKQYDRDEVLNRAMELFWERGYEATSMQSLVDVMGINRVSIYNEFGSKHALYLAALDRYRDDLVSQHLGMLWTSESGLGAIRTFLNRAVESLSRKGWQRACLMSNSTMEMAPHDEAVAERVGSHVSRMERAFGAALQRALEKGELPESADPKALAQYLTTVAQGLAIMGKATRDKKRLQTAVEVAMGSLTALRV